jgi:hypothetical protein
MVSPRLKARIAGLFYLTTIAGGVTALMVRRILFVHGDAAATTGHILGAEPLYRAAIVADLIGTAAYVMVTLLLYELLAPAGRTFSRLAAGISLVGCTIGLVILIGSLAPLILLAPDADFLIAAFSQPQLQALSLVFLRLHDQGFNLGMTCFGVYCFLLGVLVLRSDFLPKFVGVLLLAAGIGWLSDSFTTLLAPSVSLGPFPSIAGFLGEGTLTVWLLAVGVDEAKWKRQAEGDAPG